MREFFRVGVLERKKWRSKPWSRLFTSLLLLLLCCAKSIPWMCAIAVELLFALPSSHIPGQSCLHWGQACCTSGENCRCENLAKYFVATVNCGSGVNLKTVLPGLAPPLFCHSAPHPPSEFGHLFCCLWSFKKLDCFSVVKITHTSDLLIATSQGERGIWGQCGQQWAAGCFHYLATGVPRTERIEGHAVVCIGKCIDGLDQIPKTLSSYVYHLPFFIPYPWGSCPIFWVKEKWEDPTVAFHCGCWGYSVCRVLHVSPFFSPVKTRFLMQNGSLESTKQFLQSNSQCFMQERC